MVLSVDWIAKFIGARKMLMEIQLPGKHFSIYCQVLAIVTAAMITNVGWQS
jgi:hypothetical protein